MSTRLVTLATFPSAVEAALARNLLEDAGIRVQATEDATASMWGGMFGGVKLLVDEADADRAGELLDQAMGEPLAADDEPQDNHAHSPYSARENSDAASPGVGETAIPDLPEHVRNWIDWAWRAACFSPIVIPPLLNVYSAWLLLRASQAAPSQLPPAYQRKFHAALLIDLVVAGVSILIWMAILRDW